MTYLKWCHETLSGSLLNSRYMTSTDYSLRMGSAALSQKEIKLVWHMLLLTNPSCLLLISFFLSSDTQLGFLSFVVVLSVGGPIIPPFPLFKYRKICSSIFSLQIKKSSSILLGPDLWEISKITHKAYENSEAVSCTSWDGIFPDFFI